MPYRTDDRLELALRASNEGIWDWDLIKDEIHYSGRILRFLGRRRLEMPNLFRAADLIHEADRDYFIRGIRDVLQPDGKDLLAVEPRIRVAKGEGDWHWFRIRGVVVRDAEGRAVRMAGSMIDRSFRPTGSKPAGAGEPVRSIPGMPTATAGSPPSLPA